MTSMWLGHEPETQYEQAGHNRALIPGRYASGQQWVGTSGRKYVLWVASGSQSGSAAVAVAVAVTRALCYTVAVSSPALVPYISAHPCLPGC